MIKPFVLPAIALSVVACASYSAYEIARYLSPEPLFAYSESQVTAHGLMLDDAQDGGYPAYRVATAITPNNWQVVFSTDRSALSSISWKAGDLWTDALNQWGKENRLNIMLDGATRTAVVSNEQARRNSGTQWVNSNNPLHVEMYAPERRFNEYKKYQHKRVSEYLNMPTNAVGDINEAQARLYMLMSIEQAAAPTPIELGPYEPKKADQEFQEASTSEHVNASIATLPNGEVKPSQDEEVVLTLEQDLPTEDVQAVDSGIVAGATGENDENEIGAESSPSRDSEAEDLRIAAIQEAAQKEAAILAEQLESMELALSELREEVANNNHQQQTDIEQRRARNESATRELENALLEARRAHAAKLQVVNEREQQRLIIAREEAQAAREDRIRREKESRETEESLRRERHAHANEEYREAKAKLAQQIQEEAERRRLEREAQIIAEQEERERYMAMRNEFTQNGVLREYVIGDIGISMKSGSLKNQVNSILLDAKLVDEEAQIFWEFGRNYRWPREIELRRGDIDELLTTIMTPFGLRVTFTMNGLAIISQNN